LEGREGFAVEKRRGVQLEEKDDENEGTWDKEKKKYLPCHL